KTRLPLKPSIASRSAWASRWRICSRRCRRPLEPADLRDERTKRLHSKTAHESVRFVGCGGASRRNGILSLWGLVASLRYTSQNSSLGRFLRLNYSDGDRSTLQRWRTQLVGQTFLSAVWCRQTRM